MRTHPGNPSAKLIPIDHLFSSFQGTTGPLSVGMSVGSGVSVRVGVWVGVAVKVAVKVGVEVIVAVAVGVTVFVGAKVKEGVGVAVACTTWVNVGGSVGVCVNEAVDTGGVAVLIWVAVGVRELAGREGTNNNSPAKISVLLPLQLPIKRVATEAPTFNPIS